MKKSLACLIFLTFNMCTHERIPNTDVESTSENRAVVNYVEKYRKALEQRDVAGLLSMAGKDYYDDNGTPKGEDDIDYKSLSESLKNLRQSVLDVRYAIRYRRVSFERDRVLVDYTYSASFRIATAEGERWTRRLADNRLVLRRQGDTFAVVSGM